MIPLAARHWRTKCLRAHHHLCRSSVARLIEPHAQPTGAQAFGDLAHALSVAAVVAQKYVVVELACHTVLFPSVGEALLE